MSDVKVMGRSSDQLGKVISLYIDRCVLLMELAFKRDFDTRQAFRVWLDEQFRKTKSPAVLLHDDPVYTVARFLGIPRLEIDQSVMKKATKLARDQHW